MAQMVGRSNESRQAVQVNRPYPYIAQGAEDAEDQTGFKNETKSELSKFCDSVLNIRG
jgi:hypothetical protein